MRVAVLASGRGSNFQSILDASERGKLPNCKIKLLIVNKKEAYAIERAKKHNVPYYIIAVSYTHLTQPPICTV